MLKVDTANRRMVKSSALLLCGGIVLSASAGCKAKFNAGSSLRSASYQAPFAATLSASEAGWRVDISQNGGPSTDYAVESVSYISSGAAVPAIVEGAATSGTLTFNANVNYTFQFAAVRTSDNARALCETTYAAPLRYAVEPSLIKCDKDLAATSGTDNQGQTGPSTNAVLTEAEADQTIASAIVQYKVTVNDALTSLVQDHAYAFSSETVSRWNSIGSRAFQIVERYAGNEIAATEEIINTLNGTVQVPDTSMLAQGLIAAYTKPANQRPDSKACTCTVTTCTAGECTADSEVIRGIFEAAACAAKSGSVESSNSDPSSLFNDGLTTREFSDCALR